MDADGKTIELAKDGGDWKLEKPLEARADFGSVEELIGRLQSVQMKSIVANDATPADLKKFGFDKPAATVTFDIGSARASLLLGGAADATSVYARDSSRPMVMTVESALLTDLKKGADDLPPEGHLRLPRVQCDARRADARRPDGRLRAGQGHGQGRARTRGIA